MNKISKEKDISELYFIIELISGVDNIINLDSKSRSKLLNTKVWHIFKILKRLFSKSVSENSKNTYSKVSLIRFFYEIDLINETNSKNYQRLVTSQQFIVMLTTAIHKNFETFKESDWKSIVITKSDTDIFIRLNFVEIKIKKSIEVPPISNLKIMKRPKTLPKPEDFPILPLQIGKKKRSSRPVWPSKLKKKLSPISEETKSEPTPGLQEPEIKLTEEFKRKLAMTGSFSHDFRSSTGSWADYPSDDDEEIY